MQTIKQFTDTWSKVSADYIIGQQSRLQRKRPGVDGLGRSADYHYRTERSLMVAIETARDDDRNNQVIGQGISRAVDNILQGGFGLDSKTGSRKLDKEIEDWWTEVSSAKTFSSTGKFNFYQLTKLALRAVIVDGDIVGLTRDNDTLQLVEAHRLRTPYNSLRSSHNVVHGIVFDDDAAPTEYWITKEDINPFYSVQRMSEIDRFPAKDPDTGFDLVFHLFNPKRITQRRGFTSMAPISLPTGMLDDIMIAKLVQQQTASAITILTEQDKDALKYRNRSKSQKLGKQTTETLDDNTSRIIEELACGVQLKGLPGEKLTGFSANIPNPEFFAHARLVLTILGLNLGLPLVVFLMDASETNFSGWRGAMEQGKMGWKAIQRFLRDDWCCPIYLWKLRNYIASDPSFKARVEAAARDTIARGRPFNVFKHGWNPPTWPYVQPVEDATANLLKRHGLLTSPRRLAAEDGLDFREEIVRETVSDYYFAIRMAIKAALKINASLSSDDLEFMRVHWRDMLSLPMPDRVTLAMSQQFGGSKPEPKPAAGLPGKTSSSSADSLTSMVSIISQG